MLLPEKSLVTDAVKHLTYGSKQLNNLKAGLVASGKYAGQVVDMTTDDSMVVHVANEG